MLILLVLSGLIAFIGCAALLRAGQESSRKYWQLRVPQRFHVGHVPRLGGAAMLLACIAGWLWMAVSEPVFGIVNTIPFTLEQALTWIVVAVIGVAAGIIEDMTHQLQAALAAGDHHAGRGCWPCWCSTSACRGWTCLASMRTGRRCPGSAWGSRCWPSPACRTPSTSSTATTAWPAWWR